MAVRRAFDYDDFEGEFEILNSPNLFQFNPLPNNAFEARISGFDWKIATAPPEVHDPGRPVLQIHRAAVLRIAREIIARTTPLNCVALTVTGFADPGGEGGIADAISKKRADAILGQILSQLPSANRARVKKASTFVMGANPIWPSDTHKHRALNRRVEVRVVKANCGMTL